ncbi:MAG: EamA family transporter [Dehalococcoidia bacterium]|nr:EamA family transporter [Dehalococcoidia bacterium]
MKPLHLAVLVFQGSLVGSTFLMIKVLVDEIDPTLVVAGRLVLAASLAFAIVLAMRLPMPRKRSSYFLLFISGSVGLALPFFFVTWGETRISSSSTSVLSAAMPIITACMAVWFLYDEHLTPGKVLGLVVGFVGVAILSGGDFIDVGESALLGDLAIVGAAFFYSIATILVRRHLRGENQMVVAAFILLFAAIVSVPVALLIEPPGRLAVLDELEWAAFLTLGFGTAIANLLFYWLMVRIGAMKVSMNAYIMPATGVLLGWLVLDERLAWYTLVGLGAVIVGIAMANEIITPARLRGLLRQEPARGDQSPASAG